MSLSPSLSLVRFRPPPSSRTRALVVASAVLLGAALLLAESAPAQTCAHYDQDRQPFFGDVHVHSALSFDAYLFETRNGPRDAYRFARGEAVGLAPLDAMGEPTRTHRLRAPLDFAAVTDHAEMLGETSLCGVLGLDAPACQVFETTGGDGFAAALRLFSDQFGGEDPERLPFCGEGGVNCLATAAGVWDEIALAAEAFDDPDGDCRFTTFTAYEWTASPGNDTLHRNVLFRGSDVPPIPLSYVEVQTPTALWNGLQTQCASTGGDCAALTIPHNSNQSAGRTFLTTEDDGSPMTRETARLRNEMEPLVELMQHKGDSECRTGVGTTDELCGFEKIPEVPVETDAPLSYVRGVLKAGLEIDDAIGVNPFTLGLIASSDTHNGTPGATTEDDFPGHAGAIDADVASRLAGNTPLQNPGGLMVLWAEENTREALWAAMQRRETYATSGTRPSLRFFGGQDLPTGLCNTTGWASQAYATGVPMGGTLVTSPGDAAPRFVVAGGRDPGTPGFPGTNVAEIQIVKGWLDANGEGRETVVSVVGDDPPPDAVDLLTCEVDGSGAAGFCGEWQDPDFDPDVPAFYYARLLESPTCRWTTRQCRASGVDCTVPPPAGFEACCDGSVPETIQERATSSPIWTRPVPEPGFGVALAVGLGALTTLRRRRDED